MIILNKDKSLKTWAKVVHKNVSVDFNKNQGQKCHFVTFEIMGHTSKY